MISLSPIPKPATWTDHRTGHFIWSETLFLFSIDLTRCSQLIFFSEAFSNRSSSTLAFSDNDWICNELYQVSPFLWETFEGLTVCFSIFSLFYIISIPSHFCKWDAAVQVIWMENRLFFPTNFDIILHMIKYELAPIWKKSCTFKEGQFQFSLAYDILEFIRRYIISTTKPDSSSPGP